VLSGMSRKDTPYHLPVINRGDLRSTPTLLSSQNREPRAVHQRVVDLSEIADEVGDIGT